MVRARFRRSRENYISPLNTNLHVSRVLEVSARLVCQGLTPRNTMRHVFDMSGSPIAKIGGYSGLLSVDTNLMFLSRDKWGKDRGGFLVIGGHTYSSMKRDQMVSNSSQ